MNTLARLAIGLVVLVAVGLAAIPTVLNQVTAKKLNLNLPPADPVEVVWLDQNWSPEEWTDWYHTTQGSGFEAPIPYDWFVALEQPKVRLLGAAHSFIAPDYLARFGFLPDSESDRNPDGLPVGFAKAPDFINWQAEGETQNVGDAIGFTCAACHTGQLNFGGRGIRIEGGSAATELNTFKAATGLALALTSTLPIPEVRLLRFVDGLVGPSRFERFATRVLGPEATPEAQADLEDRLNTLMASSVKLAEATEPFYPEGPEQGEEGFTRLDALDRIGNFVFGTEVTSQNPDAGSVENYFFADAPVAYPHIWLTSWFDWVQYNGSIMQPMTRNAGEAMGVFSRVDFDADSLNVFRSNVDVRNLYHTENLLAGASACDTFPADNCPEAFQTVLDRDEFSDETEHKPGLGVPQWPEAILGPIDRDKAARGQELYAAHCQQCHLPAVSSEEIWEPQYWANIGPNVIREVTDDASSDGEVGDNTRPYLKVTMHGLYEIGTDPTTALNWYERVTDLGALPGQYPSSDPERQAAPSFDRNGIVSAGFALPYLVEQTVERAYDELEIPIEERDRYNGYRPSKVRAPFGYKAAPLAGIWAAPPYLHNGSVPNLYELLSPCEERSETFYLGSKEFDPQHVGYRTEEIPGGFLLDTRYRGNSNAGHEFKDGSGMGVIGPTLPEEDRWALVEYLKTI